MWLINRRRMPVGWIGELGIHEFSYRCTVLHWQQRHSLFCPLAKDSLIFINASLSNASRLLLGKGLCQAIYTSSGDTEPFSSSSGRTA